MATVKELYGELFAGKRITIQCSSLSRFNSLRASLHREHRISVALELSDLAICSDYDKDKGLVTLWLGKSRRNVSSSWVIVDQGDAA